MDTSSLVEAEKQHLINSFQHLSKALDQVSSTSTSYASLLAGLASTDLVYAQNGAAKIFIPPKGNALTGLLFRTPLLDSRTSATVSGASKGKRKKNPIIIDEDLAGASQSKKKGRVSEITIPLFVAKAAAPSAPESGSDIEGTDDTDDGSDSEEANVSSQSVARTPYKPLAIAAMPNPSAQAVATVAAPSLGRTSSSTYEEIQAQIAARRQKERAEKLKYDVNSEGNGKQKISAAAKGKAKMVTIPASALERSLSPADGTSATVPLNIQPNDRLRQRILDSTKKTSSKIDQKKAITSFDIPFLDSPLVVEEPDGRSLRNGEKVQNKGDAMLHSASSATGTVTGAVNVELSPSTPKKRKKADLSGKRTEFLNGMTGSSVSINSGAREAVPAAEPEAAVEASLTKKQKKKAKKEKKIQQAEAEAESTIVTAGKESKKKRKKERDGNVSLREKAIMQSMPQPAGSESQRAASDEPEVESEVEPNDSAFEVAQMLTQMSSSASKSSRAAAGTSKATAAGQSIATSHSANPSSDDADATEDPVTTSASNAEKGKGKATQPSQAPASNGTSVSLKGKEKEKKKRSSIKKNAEEAKEANAKKRAVSASLAKFASNTKGRKESKVKPVVQSRKTSFPRLSTLGMADDDEVDELASSQEKSKA